MTKAPRALAPLGLFLLLSCASTWPLVRHARDHLPLGGEDAATVPFTSAWTLWWTSDRVRHLFAAYWDAPIFFPTEGAFAFSEPMPLAGLAVAPLLWLGVSLPLAYNVFLLATLTLNGATTYWVLRRERLARGPALAGGAFVCLLPSLHTQLGVLTLVPLFGLVLTIGALLALGRAPRLAKGAQLGLAFAATYLLCGQYALFLALALAPAALVALGPRIAVAPRLRALLVALALSGVVIAPVAIAQQRAARAEHFARSEARARRGAAYAGAFLRSPRHTLLPMPAVRTAPPAGRALFPGGLKVALALLGLFAGLRRPARRRPTQLLATLLLLSVLVSVLPHLVLGGLDVHALLARVVPGLAQVRSLWRAAIVAQLALALLSALGVHACLLALRRARRHIAARGAVLVLATLLAVVEIVPPAQPLAPAPASAAYDAFANFLRRELAPNEAYCLLPMPRRRAAAAYEDVARFMMLTPRHGRAMVNGYSSYFPARHEQLRRLRPTLGDRETARLLRSHGVRLVVVRGDVATPSASGWPLRFEDRTLALRVFALPPSD